MQEFLTTLVSFPTFMFTCALVTTLLYWMVVIFGALDLDFLDSVLGLDSMEGTVDGALDSLEGVADGAVEGAAESIDGALDAGADGAAESVEGAESEHGGGLLAGLLNAMGVRGVPITIVGTFVIFWAWILSYLSTRFLGLIGATLIVGLAIVVTSSFGALFMAAISSRPFRKLFVTQQAQRRASLVGKMCTVLSARVDGKFGRAEIEDVNDGFSGSSWGERRSAHHHRLGISDDGVKVLPQGGTGQGARRQQNETRARGDVYRRFRPARHP